MAEFTWSFSSLKQFTNCAKQYQEIKVLKNFEITETEQIKYGKEVHKALEDYVKLGTPLPKNYQRFQQYMDDLTAIPGTKYPEYEMALTKDKEPCAFDDDGRWVRGIADLLIVNGDEAYIVDYKTGSNRYPDPKQLKLMALMTFAHFPEVETIHAGLLFVMHNTFITEEYNRNQTEQLWSSFTAPLMMLNNAYETDKWMPNPTALCRFCPVSSCDFNRG